MGTLVTESPQAATYERVGRFPTRYPYLNATVPDRYATVNRIRYEQKIPPFLPRNATRTIFKNWALRSSSFGTAPWAATGAPSISAGAYVGNVTLDLIGDSVGSSSKYFTQTVAFPADAQHAVSICLRRGTTPGKTSIAVYDTTAAAFVLSATVDFSAATPVAAATTGTVVRTVGPIDDDLYRFVFLTAAVTAAHTNSLGVSPSVLAAAGNVYAGGVQVENALDAGPVITTTVAARQVSSPDINPDNPFEYQVGEEFEEQKIQDPLFFSRIFASIPGIQYQPTQASFIRPVMHDIKSGTSYAVSFDKGLTSHIFASRLAVSSINSITLVTKGVSGSIDVSGTVGRTGTIPREEQAFSHDTLGAYFVSFAASAGSGAFYTNSGASGIKSALETGTGLTVGVTEDTTGLIITIKTGTLYYITTSDSHIRIIPGEGNLEKYHIVRAQTSAFDLSKDTVNTVDTHATTQTPTVTETYNHPDSLRVLQVPSHGLTSADAGQWFAGWNVDRLVFAAWLDSVPTNGTLAVSIRYLPGKDDIITHVQVAKNGTRYVNGPCEGSARKVLRHYLPGVTDSVATADDIPAFPSKRSAILWMGEIVAGSAYIVVETSRLGKYEDRSAIVVKETTEVKASEFIVTENASA